jgi:hypothetical protein
LGMSLGPYPAAAQILTSGVEGLYIVDCGHSVGPNGSRCPGVGVGKAGGGRQLLSDRGGPSAKQGAAATLLQQDSAHAYGVAAGV